LKDVENIVRLGRPAWDQIGSSLSAFYKTSSGEQLIERIQYIHAVA
jgi:hypothetical protein